MEPAAKGVEQAGVAGYILMVVPGYSPEDYQDYGGHAATYPDQADFFFVGLFADVMDE